MECEFKFIRQYGDKKLPFRRIQCLSPARNNDWMNLKKTKEKAISKGHLPLGY